LSDKSWFVVESQILPVVKSNLEAASPGWGGYNWLPIERRQLCWAHLKREFTKIAQRAGVSRTLGEELLEQERQLCELWYRVRDGTLARTEFIELVRPIRERILALLKVFSSILNSLFKEFPTV